MSPVTPSASTSLINKPLDSSNPKEQDIWFDAIDHVEIEDTWFDTLEEYPSSSSSTGGVIDSQVPFTEDCRRGIQQFIRTLGEYGEGRILSACFSGLLPGIPASLVIAANSLYTAITERRNIDVSTVHVLRLVSWYLPDNINVISRLATFIRDIVIGWTDETFLRQFLGDEENQTSIQLFTALAVTVIVAGRWMKDEGAPQRGVLKIPAFMANIFIRTSHYWTELGNMARSLPSSLEITGNTEPLQRVPAFEVDTEVEITKEVCDTTIFCSSPAPRLSAFSANSTVNSEAYTRATVQNRPTSENIIHHSVPEQAYYRAMDKLRQESGLSNLLYCMTRKTETRQQTNEKIVTSTHFNTKCDAIVYTAPFWKVADMIPVHTDIPVSSATERSGGGTFLPMVMTGAAVMPAATFYMQALRRKSVITAGSALGLVGLTVGGKFLWNSLSSSKPISNDERNSNLLSATVVDTQKMNLSGSPQDAPQKYRYFSSPCNVPTHQEIVNKEHVRIEEANPFHKKLFDNKTTLIDFLAYKEIAILYREPTEHIAPPSDDGIVLDFETSCFLLKNKYGFIYLSGSFSRSEENVFLKTKHGWVMLKYDKFHKITYLADINDAIIYDIFPDEIKLIKDYEKIRKLLTNLMKSSINHSRSQNYLEIIITFHERIERRISLDFYNPLNEILSNIKNIICLEIVTTFQVNVSNSFDCALKHLIRGPDLNNIDFNTDIGPLMGEFFSGTGFDSIRSKLFNEESVLKLMGESFLFKRLSYLDGEIKNKNFQSLRVKFYPGIGWACHEDFLSKNATDLVRGKYFPYLHNEVETIPELRDIINDAIKNNVEHHYFNFLQLFRNKLKKYIMDLELKGNRERDQVAAFVILIKIEGKISLLNKRCLDNIVLRGTNFFDDKITEKFNLLNEIFIERTLYDEAVSTNFNKIKPFVGMNKKTSQVSEDAQYIKERIKLFNRLKNKKVSSISLYEVISSRPFMVRNSASALKERSEVRKEWDLKINEQKRKLKITEDSLCFLKGEETKQKKHFAIINKVISEFDTFNSSDKNEIILFYAYINILTSMNNKEIESDEEILKNSYRILHYRNLDYHNEIYRLIIPNIQDDDIDWIENKNILDIKEAKVNAVKIFKKIYRNTTEEPVGYLLEFITSYIFYKHDHKQDNLNPLDIIAYYNKKKEEYLGSVIFTDFTNRNAYTMFGDFMPRSCFTSRTEYTDQFNNYLDSNSLDFDVKTLSNLAIYNSDNLIIEDLVLPPRNVAYYKYSGGELKRHYKKNNSPVLGFYGVIECNSGNYLLIKYFSGQLQSQYKSAEELKSDLSLNSSNKFGFEREYSAIVSGGFFGDSLSIHTDTNKKYESNLYREDYFQEFHGKKYNSLKHAIFPLIKKYLSYEVESLKENMDQRSTFNKALGYFIPFFNEIYGALTDSHHKYDTDSIIIDAFSIATILTISGAKIVRLSSQEIDKITLSSLYYRNLGSSGFRLAELVLSDVMKMSIPIKNLSISEVKKIMIELIDPIGITNHIITGREKNIINILEAKNHSPDFYADLHNFAKSSTELLGDVNIFNKNGQFKVRFDPAIKSYRLLNSYAFNVPLRLNIKSQWEVNYEIFSKENLKYMDEVNTSYFLKQKKNIFKSNDKYQGPGTSRSPSADFSQIENTPINKSIGETITRTDLGKNFLLYSRRDEFSSTHPADRIFVTAHGEATILKRKFIIPDNSEIEFLTPHRSKMVSPGVDIINLPYLESHSTINNTGFSTGNIKPDGSPHTYTDNAKFITGISEPKPGEVRDYNLSFFDGDTENDIAEAINYNRDRRHPFVPKTDVVTVKNKLNHELIEPTLSNLIKELKKIEHPAKTITVCICRESMFHKGFIYDPKRTKRTKRTKREISSVQSWVVDIYNYDINAESFYLVSHWSSVLNTGDIA